MMLTCIKCRYKVSTTVVILITIPGICRIAREKTRGSVGREYFVEKISWNVKAGRIMGVACLLFPVEKTFTDG